MKNADGIYGNEKTAKAVPVDPGAFHRYQGAAARPQPGTHLGQFAAGGAEAADLFATTLATAVQAGHHAGLVHVQAGAASNDCFHAPLHVWCNRLRRAIKSDSTMRAPRCRGRQRAIPLRRRGSNSVSGLLSITRQKNDLEAITPSECRGLLRAARCTRPTHGHFQPSRCRRRRLVNSTMKIELVATVADACLRPLRRLLG